LNGIAQSKWLLIFVESLYLEMVISKIFLSSVESEFAAIFYYSFSIRSPFRHFKPLSSKQANRDQTEQNFKISILTIGLPPLHLSRISDSSFMMV
jgi:hypothetical protein